MAFGEADQGRNQQRLVLHQAQHGDSLRSSMIVAHRSRAAGAAAQATGAKCRDTMVPSPGVDWIAMEPRMDCITRWQNISPIPLPPACARVVTGSCVSLASTSG